MVWKSREWDRDVPALTLFTWEFDVGAFVIKDKKAKGGKDYKLLGGQKKGWFPCFLATFDLLVLP